MLDLGKFFVIRSQMSQLVLDVTNGSTECGTPVSTYEYNGGLNQQWCEDSVEGVICSALDQSLVLTCVTGPGEVLHLRKFEAGLTSQQWEVADTSIVSRRDRGHVLDIAGYNRESMATVVAWPDNGGENQRWDVQYLPPKKCFIESQLNGKVLDVLNYDCSPGASVAMYEKNGGENQMFYEGRKGIIRSCLNNFSLDTHSGCLKLNKYQRNTFSKQWKKSMKRIVNAQDHGRVLDVANNSLRDGADVVDWGANGGPNQQWTFVYIEAESDPQRGANAGPRPTAEGANAGPRPTAEGANAGPRPPTSGFATQLSLDLDSGCPCM